MTTTKALAKLYRAITGNEGRNSIGKILSDLADAWATAVPSSGFKQMDNVPGAAGSNVTKAEFKALLDELIAAGIMKDAD